MSIVNGTIEGSVKISNGYFERPVSKYAFPENTSNPHTPAQLIEITPSEPFYRYYARYLNEREWLDWLLYGPLDATNLAYGLFRLSADLSGKNSQELHDWISSPEGFLLIGIEIVGLSVLGLMANKYSDSDANVLKRAVAIYYRYLRDALKAKNAFKGVRALLQAMGTLGIADANGLIIPLGILVSAIAILNRLWLRGMIEERKSMMKINIALIEEIDELQKLTLAQAAGYFARKKYQSTHLRAKAYLSSGLNGFFDGLYLYFGIIALAALSSVAPPAMIFIAVVSFIFSMACIASRLYEEWEYQQRLIILQAKIDLVLRRKILQATLEDLYRAAESGNDINQLLGSLSQQLNDFQKARQQLYQASYVPYWAQALAGLKYGLAIYGVFSCLLFTSAVFLTIFGLTIPAQLIVGVVALGIVSVLGMIIGSMVYHGSRHRSLQQDMWTTNGLLLGKLDELKQTSSLYRNEDAYYIMCSLDDHMKVGESQLWSIKEAAEIGRQGVSGLSKGMKITDWIFTAFQDVDAKGDTNDPIFVLMIGITAAVAYSLVVVLRTYAKAFNCPSLGNDVVIGKPKISRYVMFAPPRQMPKSDEIQTSDERSESPPPPSSSPPVISAQPKESFLKRSLTFNGSFKRLNLGQQSSRLLTDVPRVNAFV